MSRTITPRDYDSMSKTPRSQKEFEMVKKQVVSLKSRVDQL